MKRFHTHVGSGQPALQQRPEVLHAVSVYAAIYILNRVVNDLMSITSFQSVIGNPFVTIERGASLHMLSDFGLNGFSLSIRHDLCANTSATLQHSEHNSLVCSASSSNALLALAEVHIARL